MKTYNSDLPTFIGRYTVSKLINELDLISEDVEMPWYSYGGDVWAGMGFADYLQTSNKKILARVTGVAASMGSALLPYFSKVVGAKQADIMLHSVSSDNEKIAKEKNKQLYDILKTKINEPKFKEITGHELKTIMFLEKKDRIDVWITGQDAYDIGLFDELIDLTPEEKMKNEAILQEIKLVASLDYKLPERLLNKNEHSQTPKKEKMKIDELKASHPELYAEVLEQGKKDGLTAEQNRVNAWMVFNDVDPEAIKKGIESGVEMTKAQELTFMRKSQTLEMQRGLEGASPKDLTPDPKTGKVVVKTAAELENEKLDKALDEVGIKAEEVK